MQTVGAYEAKTYLSRLLDQVKKGEKIGITKHGVTVAILQPPATAKKANTEQVISALRMFREKHSLKGISLKEMMEEGRR